MFELADSISLILTLERPTLPLSIFTLYLSNLEIEDGCFISRLSVKDLGSLLNRTLNTIYNHRQKLIDLGLIETNRKFVFVYLYKSSSKRFIGKQGYKKSRIKRGQFSPILILSSGGTESPLKGSLCPTPNKHLSLLKESLYTNKPTLFDDTNSPKRKKTFSERCSSKLYKALAKRRKILNTSPGKWPKEFRGLLRYVPKPRIKRVLAWYCSHIGEEYVPQAYSAKTFCDKFIHIESQMIRATKDRPNEIDIDAEDYDGNVSVVTEGTMTQEEFERMSDE